MAPSASASTPGTGTRPTPEDLRVARRVVGSATVPGFARAIDPAAGALYLVAGSGVRPLDLETLELGDPIPVGGWVQSLAVDPRTGAVWACAEGGLVVLE